MDEITGLHCRIAELETLLRCKDDQLTEARAATTLLLTSISKLGHHPHFDSSSVYLSQHSQTAIEDLDPDTARDGFNHQPRGNAIVSGGNTSRYRKAKDQMQTPQVIHHGFPPSPPFTNELPCKPKAEDEVDLLGLEVVSTPLSTDTSSLSRPHGLETCIPSTSYRSENLSYGAHKGGNRVSTRSIQHVDGNTSFVTLAPPSPSHPARQIAPYNAPRTGGYARPTAFANHEHSRLMGAAMFIEGMDLVEQTQLWEDYGQKRGSRHTAEEWQAYYESKVRPLYLSKTMARRADLKRHQEADLEANVHEGCDSAFEQVGAPLKAECNEVGRELEPLENESMPPGFAKSSLQDTDIAVTHMSEAQVSRHANPPATAEDSAILQKTATVLLSPPIVMPTLKIDDSEREATPVVVPPHQISASGPLSGKTLVDRPDELSELWQYRARFHPESHKHLFRTVIISGIPSTVTLAEVLDKVAGGRVIHADMIETSLMKTKPAMHTNIVRVTFLSSGRAQGFVDFCRTNWLMHWSKDWDAPFRATAELHPFPSTCVLPDFAREIQQFGMTRVLFVHDHGKWTPEDMVARMISPETGKRQMCKRPLRAGRDGEGIMVLEFASILDAANAWQVIERHGFVFGGVSKGFFPDPCERPLGEIEPYLQASKDEQSIENSADSADSADKAEEATAIFKNLADEVVFRESIQTDTDVESVPESGGTDGLILSPVTAVHRG